jgi:putative ATPase
MLAAGEDPRFIARRMVISASEDVGLADPQALGVAVAAFQALEFVGLPEAQLNLAEAVVYLALAPKSNSATLAIVAARRELEEGGAGRVPGHLQSASHPGERRLGIGVGYVYPHDHPGHWVDQRYLPEGLRGGYYRPSDQGREAELAASWQERDRLRRGAPPPASGNDRAARRRRPEPPPARDATPRPSPDREEPTP